MARLRKGRSPLSPISVFRLCFRCASACALAPNERSRADRVGPRGLSGQITFRRGVQIAPVSAPDTSAAYFASAPVV